MAVMPEKRTKGHSRIPRRPVAPADVRSIADAYECGHCPADKTLWHDGLMWRLTVAHELMCPVYLGNVDRAPQLADALARSGVNR